MKIVVIGGTGLIGSKLVTRLGEQGHEMVAASPNTGVNTLTGEGLADDADRRVLLVQIGLGAFLNGGRDFLHARVAGRSGQNR